MTHGGARYQEWITSHSEVQCNNVCQTPKEPGQHLYLYHHQVFLNLVEWKSQTETAAAQQCQYKVCLSYRWVLFNEAHKKISVHHTNLIML